MADAMKPWMTSDDLIAAVKRKISFPISQVTFSEDDILRFANEEMMISQVPSVLQYHEEYFVIRTEVPLRPNVSRYPIPERAIGMKLRDMFWSDASGNLFEMTRINSEDKAFFQGNIGAFTPVFKFYIEGNDIILDPKIQGTVTGSLVFFYYLRPNQLVKNERAAIISSFLEKITVDNSSLVAGDTITIDDVVFTAVAGAPSTDEFQIGGTSVITATNLKNTINTNGIASSDNGSPSTSIVTLSKSTKMDVTTSNSTALSLSGYDILRFESVPDNITSGSIVDFLQTKPGHRMRKFDVTIPSNAISVSDITFTLGDLPEDLVVGDYICLANECIIPQIPPDLHNGLAERTCARILAAIGDNEGLATINSKLAEIETRQGNILDNRAEGAPAKINARHTLLRYGKFFTRRRI